MFTGCYDLVSGRLILKILRQEHKLKLFPNKILNLIFLLSGDIGLAVNTGETTISLRHDCK